MKKSSLNDVTNNQLIILAVSFTIFGFVLLLLMMDLVFYTHTILVLYFG